MITTSTEFLLGLSLGILFGILFTLSVEWAIYLYYTKRNFPAKSIENREENVIRFIAILATIILVIYIVVTKGQDMNEVFTGALIAVIGAGVVDKKISVKKDDK